MKMPRYVYECSKCGGQFKTVHGMNDTQDHCDLCFSSGCLRRIPQLTYVTKPESESSKRVREAIEDNRKILKDSVKERRRDKDDS